MNYAQICLHNTDIPITRKILEENIPIFNIETFVFVRITKNSDFKHIYLSIQVYSEFYSIIYLLNQIYI